MPLPLVDELIAAVKQDLGEVTARLIAKELTPAQWQRECENILRRNVYAAYAVGRAEPLTRAEERLVQQELNRQLNYLRGFTNDVKEGNLSDAQILNRIEMYADRLRGVEQQGEIDGLGLDLPQVPGDGQTQCFFRPNQVLVLTQEHGYRCLSNVRPGMHVLTHTGRFQQVLEQVRLEVKNCNAVVLDLTFGDIQRQFTVTPDHLFMDGTGQWVRADQIQSGMRLMRVGKHCARPGCETVFDLYKSWQANKRHCSHLCSNNIMTAQRVLNAHLANRIRKGKTYEELYGTEVALRTKEKIGALRRGKSQIELVGEKRAKEMADITRQRMLSGDARRIRAMVKNPSAIKGRSLEERLGKEKAQEVKARLSASTREQWQQNRDSLCAAIMAGNIRCRIGLPDGERTKPERIMARLLDELGVEYKEQVWLLGRFCVDFLLPRHKLVIEADGDYWHNYPDGLDFDKDRDKAITTRKGMDVMRFWEHDLERQPQKVKEELSRVLANHEGLYQPLGDVAVIGARRQLTSGLVRCLVVEGDSSFVVSNGLISHNCLTNCRCHLEFEETTRPSGRGETAVVEVRWRRDALAESCPDCVRLEQEWNPLIVKPGLGA